MASSTKSSSSPATPALVPQGPHAGKTSMPMGRPFTLIGARHRAHLHLLSRSVSKAHAVIINDNGNLYVRDTASREHVYVNGVLARESELHNNDLIRVGTFTFKLTDGNGKTRRSPSSRPAPAEIEVHGEAMSTPFQGRTLLIGRRGECDIQLAELSVSNVHALIFELDGKHWVRDLGSRTGTFVNGEKIHQHALKFGDQLRVGEHDMRFAASTALADIDELEHLVGTATLGSEQSQLASDDAARAAELAGESHLTAHVGDTIPLAEPDDLIPLQSDEPVEPEPLPAPAAQTDVDLAEIDLDNDPDVSGSGDTAAMPADVSSDTPRMPVLSSQVVDDATLGDEVGIETDERHLLVGGDLFDDRMTGSGSFANFEHTEEEDAEGALVVNDLDLVPPTEEALYPAHDVAPEPANIESMPAAVQSWEFEKDVPESVTPHFGTDDLSSEPEPANADFAAEISTPATVGAAIPESPLAEVPPSDEALTEAHASETPLSHEPSADAHASEAVVTSGNWQLATGNLPTAPTQPNVLTASSHDALDPRAIDDLEELPELPDLPDEPAEMSVEELSRFDPLPPEQIGGSGAFSTEELADRYLTAAPEIGVEAHSPHEAIVPDEPLSASEHHGEHHGLLDRVADEPAQTTGDEGLPALGAAAIAPAQTAGNDESSAPAAEAESAIPEDEAAPLGWQEGRAETARIRKHVADSGAGDFAGESVPSHASKHALAPHDSEANAVSGNGSHPAMREVFTSTEPTPESAQHLEVQIGDTWAEAYAELMPAVDDLSDTKFGMVVEDFSGHTLGALVEEPASATPHSPAAETFPAPSVEAEPDLMAEESASVAPPAPDLAVTAHDLDAAGVDSDLKSADAGGMTPTAEAPTDELDMLFDSELLPESEADEMVEQAEAFLAIDESPMDDEPPVEAQLAEVSAVDELLNKAPAEIAPRSPISVEPQTPVERQAETPATIEPDAIETETDFELIDEPADADAVAPVHAHRAKHVAAEPVIDEFAGQDFGLEFEEPTAELFAPIPMPAAPAEESTLTAAPLETDAEPLEIQKAPAAAADDLLQPDAPAEYEPPSLQIEEVDSELEEPVAADATSAMAADELPPAATLPSEQASPAIAQTSATPAAPPESVAPAPRSQGVTNMSALLGLSRDFGTFLGGTPLALPPSTRNPAPPTAPGQNAPSARLPIQPPARPAPQGGIGSSIALPGRTAPASSPAFPQRPLPPAQKKKSSPLFGETQVASAYLNPPPPKAPQTRLPVSVPIDDLPAKAMPPGPDTWNIEAHPDAPHQAPKTIVAPAPPTGFTQVIKPVVSRMPMPAPVEPPTIAPPAAAPLLAPTTDGHALEEIAEPQELPAMESPAIAQPAAELEELSAPDFDAELELLPEEELASELPEPLELETESTLEAPAESAHDAAAEPLSNIFDQPDQQTAPSVSADAELEAMPELFTDDEKAAAEILPEADLLADLESEPAPASPLHAELPAEGLPKISPEPALQDELEVQPQIPAHNEMSEATAADHDEDLDALFGDELQPHGDSHAVLDDALELPAEAILPEPPAAVFDVEGLEFEPSDTVEASEIPDHAASFEPLEESHAPASEPIAAIDESLAPAADEQTPAAPAADEPYAPAIADEAPAVLFDAAPHALDALPDVMEPIADVTEAVGEKAAPAAPATIFGMPVGLTGSGPLAAPVEGRAAGLKPRRTTSGSIDLPPRTLRVTPPPPARSVRRPSNPNAATGGSAVPAGDPFSQQTPSLDAFSGAELPPSGYVPPGGAGPARKPRQVGEAARPPVARKKADAISPQQQQRKNAEGTSAQRPPSAGSNGGNKQKGPRKPVIEPIYGDEEQEQGIAPIEEALQQKELHNRPAEPGRRPQKKKWRFPFLGVLTLAVVGGAGAAGVWYAMPAKSNVAAAMRFEKLDQIADTSRFTRGQKALMETDEFRKAAQDIYEKTFNGQPGEGFLYRQAGQDVDFTRTVEEARIEGDRLLLQRQSSDPQGDRLRFEAVLKALYASDLQAVLEAKTRDAAMDGMQKEFAQAEQRVADLRKRIDDGQKQQVQFEAARKTEKDLSDQSASLEKAWSDASAATRKARADLDAMEAAQGQPQPAIDSDPQLQQMNEQLRKLSDALTAARGAHLGDAKNAAGALDAALAKYKAEIERVKAATADNSPLAGYMGVAVQVQGEIQKINAELASRQAVNQQTVADLNQKLADKIEAHLKRMWAGDADLKKYEQDLAVQQHRLGAASGAGLRDDAARIQIQVDALKKTIDARRTQLAQPDAYPPEIATMQKLLADQTGQMRGEQARADQRFNEQFKLLAAAAPQPQTLSDEQQKTFDGLVDKLVAVGAARQQLSQAAAPALDADVKALQVQTTELAAGVEARRHELAAIAKAAAPVADSDAVTHQRAAVDSAQQAETFAFSEWTASKAKLASAQMALDKLQSTQPDLVRDNTDLAAIIARHDELKTQIAQGGSAPAVVPVDPDHENGVQVTRLADQNRLGAEALIAAAFVFGSMLLITHSRKHIKPRPAAVPRRTPRHEINEDPEEMSLTPA